MHTMYMECTKKCLRDSKYSKDDMTYTERYEAGNLAITLSTNRTVYVITNVRGRFQLSW